MRYFSVSREERPIALVFHDYMKGLYYCRTSSDSFRRAFDVVSAKHRYRAILKNGVNLHVSLFGPGDFGWVDHVLEQFTPSGFTYTEVKKGPLWSGSFDDLVHEVLGKNAQ